MRSANRDNAIIGGLVIAAIIISGLLGFYFSTITFASSASGSSGNSNNTQSTGTVNMDIIPDYGGPGYDAFVLAANVADGSVPTPATNTTAAGMNDNNVTVSTGTAVKFVITSIDTAILQNFSGQVSTPFVVYNDTNSGMVAAQYDQGQSISNMSIGHTFTITQLGVNIPIPPSTVVSFSLTFTKPGVYMYKCETPCGPGMGLMGYMEGYVIVK